MYLLSPPDIDQIFPALSYYISELTNLSYKNENFKYPTYIVCDNKHRF